MREPAFLVLTALAGGRSHGYALLSDVEFISRGRVRLQVGSLYAVLDRLERERLVQVVGEEIVSGRTRRYFELTDDGRAALAAEAEALASNAREARQRLKAKPSTTLAPNS